MKAIVVSLILLALVVIFALSSCARVPPCRTAIAFVGTQCTDPRYALCDLNFANPIPTCGCEMPIDPHGPQESSVTCVRTCPP